MEQPNARPRASAIFLALAALLAIDAHCVSAANCAPCLPLLQQKTQLEQAQQAADGLLQQNRAALAALAPGDISKKVKISSNIVILATRSEQAANSRSLIENDFKAKGCDQCPLH